MHGKLMLTIGDCDIKPPVIEFNMDNESEREFFYKMQEFLLNKGLLISICFAKDNQRGD